MRFPSLRNFVWRMILFITHATPDLQSLDAVSRDVEHDGEQIHPILIISKLLTDGPEFVYSLCGERLELLFFGVLKGAFLRDILST